MHSERKYPAEYREGLRLYWAGEFWHSHEAWEDVWRRSSGAQRHFYQGLIQIDAALIHTKKAHWGGVANLLTRALSHLEHCPRRLLGMNVANLRKQVRAYRRAVCALRSRNATDFDWSLQPKLQVEGLSDDKHTT